MYAHVRTYAQVYTHMLAHLLLQSSNAVLLCPECVPGLSQLLLEKVHLHLQFTGLLRAGGQLLGQKVESLLLLLDLSSTGGREGGREGREVREGGEGGEGGRRGR